MIDIQFIITISLIGSFIGFISGTLGIGGGTMIVPVVSYILNKFYGHLQYSQQIALGTTFLIMAFISLSNIISQKKFNNIEWNIFKKLSITIIIGIFFGSLIAYYISSDMLKIIFILFIIMLIINNIFDQTNLNTKKNYLDTVNIKYYYLIIGGSVIGIVSSLVGIAGAIMIIAFLSHFKLNFKKCIGTAAAIGCPVTLTGSLSYLITGLHVENLPKYTIGFLHLPSFILLAISTTIFVPLGVKFGNYISQKTLKILFLILLLSIVIRMSLTLIYK